MPSKHRWATHGIEPDLHDLLADPVVELVMRRDGIVAGDVWAAVQRARSRLRQPRPAEIENAA